MAELERKSRPVVMLMWVIVVLAGFSLVSTLADLSLHSLGVLAVLMLAWMVVRR